MTPLVIPVFISHQGCPHRCIFCDQHTITGRTNQKDQPVTPDEVRQTIEKWLTRSGEQANREVQVAFYGGSFTGLPKLYQGELLEAVKPFLADGMVQTVRLSTRPDYVNREIVDFLKNHGVGIVELGVQSMDPEVLKKSGRGHTVEESAEAVGFLKEKSLTVGVQLMCGLPGDTTVKILATAREVIGLAPDFVRIYPTLVIRDSGLAMMYRQGSYKPLSLNKAVAQAGMLRDIFEKQRIRVVRMGLQPSEELQKKVLDGPYHPAFGELVASRRLFKKARQLLAAKQSREVKKLSIAAADESAFRGPGNVNMKRLAELGLLDGVEFVFNHNQSRNSVTVN
jgi:histone acetyltransferase (RNA polymerase elongator complex component)